MSVQLIERSRTFSLAWVLYASCLTPLYALEKPPLSPDQATPYIAPSHVSATVSFSTNALASALDEQIPRRLATFDDQVASCGRHQCVYSGYVERTTAIVLHAEGDRLSAAVPLDGFVAVQGARGLGRILHGTAEGQMTVYAQARPQLNPDWSIALNLDDSFRWTDPPVLRVLGFQFGIAHSVEPQIRTQTRRVEAKVMDKVAALGLRSKAETAWQCAFEPVKITDDPELWLQMTPDSVAYSGMRTTGEALEGAIEIAGRVETLLGAKPPTPTPTPLPQLGSNVADPGRFEFLVPVSLSYQTIRQALQSAIAASGAGNLVRDVDVYPSAGKLVIGLQMEQKSQSNKANADDWVYLSASPQIDNDNKVIRLPDVSVVSSAAPGSPGPVFNDDDLINDLRRQVISYKAPYDKLLSSASAALVRDLGDGFKSEGSVTSASIEKIALPADGLVVVLRATGDLKIVYAQ